MPLCATAALGGRGVKRADRHATYPTNSAPLTHVEISALLFPAAQIEGEFATSFLALDGTPFFAPFALLSHREASLKAFLGIYFYLPSPSMFPGLVERSPWESSKRARML